MQTSEVLNLAADLIEERGWQDNRSGGVDLDQLGWDTGNGAPLCLEGGIMAALGIAATDVTSEWAAQLGSCPAYRSVQVYLGIDYELWHYNDSYNRTAAEVIATLRACAVIEAARESAESHQPEAVTS